MPTEIESQLLNEQFFAKIARNGDGPQKEAADAGSDYIRETLRDEGLLRKILPMESITDADLDEVLDSDKPTKICYKEVSQPLSVSVPLATLPNNVYMNFKKFRVDFGRILTRNFVGDIRQISNYKPDIRTIFKENAIKDMMTAEDVPFFQTIRAIVSSAGTPGTLGDPSAPVGNQPSSLTGKVQYYDFSDATKNPLGITGFSRETTTEARKILPRGYGDPAVATPIRNPLHLVIMNVNTLAEYAKFNRSEAGGDIAEKMLVDGVTEGTFGGVKHIGTLKDDIVKDGEAFYFAPPNHLGRSFSLESPTLFMETRAYMMEFFAYSMVGASVANPYGVSICKFF